jgi:hypothetical protein
MDLQATLGNVHAQDWKQCMSAYNDHFEVRLLLYSFRSVFCVCRPCCTVRVWQQQTAGSHPAQRSASVDVSRRPSRCGPSHSSANAFAAAACPGRQGPRLPLPTSPGTQLELNPSRRIKPAGLVGQVAAVPRSAWAAALLQLLPGAVAAAVVAALIWGAAAAAASAPSTVVRKHWITLRP